MNAQNTPVHIRLWHHDFWRLAIAHLLLALSVYALVPVLPRWLMDSQYFSPAEVGLAMVFFAVGLFVPGCLVAWLVQHYRRNQVCLWAMTAMLAALGVLYYLDSQHCAFCDFWVVCLQRLLHGAAFSLAQMVLVSTLIIDVSESYRRTEACHASAWFSRLALALGPLAALWLSGVAGFQSVLWLSAGSVVLALVLVMLVEFPFRAPQEHQPVVSLDRFFLSDGWILFLNFLLVSLSVGLLLSLSWSVGFFCWLFCGFLLAMLAQRFVFRDADLKSEVVSGLLLMGAALLMLITRTQDVVHFLSPLMVGAGVALVASRFLLFFIKLSRHLQRGTAQSTFLLGWESGLALGVALGIGLLRQQPHLVLLASLLLVSIALLLYQYAHRWFLAHKNR